MNKKSLSYVLMFFGMMLLPFLRVSADPIELDTTFKHNNASTSYLELVDNKYSVDFTEGNINDQYSFQFKSDDLEADNTYILVFDYNFFLSSDENHSIRMGRKLLKFLGSELLTGQIVDIPDPDFVVANGQYKINVNVYPLSIYDDAYEGDILGSTIDDLETFFNISGNLDISSYTPATFKNIEISNINVEDGLELNELSYVADNSVLTKDLTTDKYLVDAAKYEISNLLKLKLNFNVGNYDPSDLYNVVICYNDLDCTYTTRGMNTGELVTLFETGIDIDMSSRIAGDHKITVSIGNGSRSLYETELILNIPEITEIDMESLKNDFLGINDLNLNTKGTLLSNYVALSVEDKELLNLGDVLTAKIEKYITEFSKIMADNYVNNAVKVNFNDKKLVNSFNKLGNKTYASTLNIHGVFVGNANNMMTVGNLFDLFILENNEILDIKITENNEEVVDLTKKLNNKMVLEVFTMNKVYKYNIVILGNVISDNGLIKVDDIEKAVDTLIGTSNLDSSILSSVKINDDDKVDVTDIGLLNRYLLASEDQEFAYDIFLEYDDINVILNSDKTFARVGDTFKVYLNIQGIDSNKFNGIQGTLDYDKDLFELLSVSFVDETLNWYGNINSDTSSESFGKFLWYGGQDIVDTNGKLIEFTFKANAIGNSTISLKDIILAYYGDKLTLVNETNDDLTDYQVNMNIERALYTNNNIESLLLSNGSIDFSSEVLSYTVHVLNTLTEFTIDGTLENDYATTDAFKTYELKDTYTFIDLVVEAENGELKTYKIEVIRDIVPIKDKVPTQDTTYQKSNDNYIKSLEITNHGIIFDKNVYEYNINVDNNVDNLELVIVLNNDRATFNVSGNENFKSGKNTVVITVKAENGEEKQYSIIVNKALETDEEETTTKSKGNTKLVLIIMIALTIVGLGYLLLKKDGNDEPNFEEITIKKSKNKTNKK